MLEIDLLASAIVLFNWQANFDPSAFKDQTIIPADEMLRRCIKTSANLIGEPVTVMARAESFREHQFDGDFAFRSQALIFARTSFYRIFG